MIQSLLNNKNNNNLSLIHINSSPFLIINNIYYFLIIINLCLILIVNCNNNNLTNFDNNNINILQQIQYDDSLQNRQQLNNNNENTNEETEIIVIDHGFRPYPHVYHFEDFFWTGSGDGSTNDNTVTVTKHWPIATDSLDNDVKPTVYLTSTVTSTVIITRTSDFNEKNDENSTTNCMQNSNNCEESSSVTTTTVVTPTLPIQPTKTSEWENVSTSPSSPKDTTIIDDQATTTWWSTFTPTTPSTINIDSITTDNGVSDTSGGAHEVNTITIIIDTHRYQVPDRKYWIITILEDTTTGRSNGTINITTSNTLLPSLQVFENRLAILYHIAFYRQQQKHLGIQNNRSKRSLLINKRGGSVGRVTTRSSSSSSSSSASSELYIKKQSSLEKINVQIHNISTNIENNDLELVYSVRVGGQPVPAKTAAADMRLVTNDEVIQQFGSYAVKTKAEPYLKDETKPLGLARYENTWLFIGSAIGILIILLITLILIIFGIQHRTKHKRDGSTVQLSKSKSIISTDDECQDYDATTSTAMDKQHSTRHVIQSVLRMEDAQVQTCTRLANYVPTTTNTFHKSVRNIHVAASISSESSSSSDTVCSISPSPVSRRRYNQWKQNGNRDIDYEQEDDRHINQQMLDDYDGGYKEVVDAKNIVAIRKASDVRSAHSYLSMPSVKNFPRGSIPEPLSRVLEPVSIRHLDDGLITPIESPMKTPPTLMRHGSMQEAEDPGVIGPLVWNQHCQKLNQAIQPTNNNEPPNVGRMKKRFQELLDDAFSLFGSRSVSPEDQAHGGPPPPQMASVRAHSAYPRLSSTDDTIEPRIQQRPKTSIPGRKSQYPPTTSDYIEPKCAWTGSSGTPSPLVRSGGSRPLSAGPFHRPTLAPHICPVRILPEGRLDASDTAVPVIEAIKNEIRKCGRTSPTPRKK